MWHAVVVFHSWVFDVPVALRLEFVAVVDANVADAEWELLDYIVNAIYGVLLRVPLINLQSPDARRIVNGRVLEAAHFLLLIIFEDEELHIYLDVMAGHLFFVELYP